MTKVFEILEITKNCLVVRGTDRVASRCASTQDLILGGVGVKGQGLGSSKSIWKQLIRTFG